METNTVAIMMSTYNGSRYVREQIESIANQRGVDCHLFVRDDGSGDNTVDVVREACSDFGLPLTLVQDGLGNLGVYGSWDELLRYMDGSFPYYAIADQDDVWLPEKLGESVRALAEDPGAPCVYTCGSTAVDENGNILRKRTFLERQASVESLFLRYAIPAHAMTFNRSLFMQIQSYRVDATGVDLEPCILLTALCDGGQWIRDSRSFVRWRRLGSQNVTVVGKGRWARLSYELKCMSRGTNRAEWASYLLSNYGDRLDESTRNFLETARLSRTNVRARLRLMTDRSLTTGNLAADILGKLAVALGRW